MPTASEHHMTTHITELDAAIIAEEQGWDYVPACDEAYLLLADSEQITVATAPQPKLNRKLLRRDAIRWAMRLVKDDEDWQQIQWELANHDLFSQLAYGMTVDEAADYYVGIIRFCEHALRRNQ
jgi:hypothetical protein